MPLCSKPELILALPYDLSVQKSAFHRPQTLAYKDGYALPRRPCVGIGQDPLLSEQLIQQEISQLSFERPDVTYNYTDRGLAEEFIPAHVALDKKVDQRIFCWLYIVYIYFLFCIFIILFCRFCASMHSLRRASLIPLMRSPVFALWSFTTTLKMTACTSLSQL